MDIVSYLDQHAGAVQGVATGILVVITGWYAMLTRHIAMSAREAQRPYVFVDIGGEGGPVLEFVVGNDGDRAAQDIRLDLDDRGDDELRKQLRNLHPFKGGISYLAPHRRYRYRVIVNDDTVFSDDRVDHVVLSISAHYRDSDRSYRDRFSIDVTALSGVLLSSFTEPVESIARQLKELVRMERSRSSRRPMEGMLRPAVKLCPFCASQIPVAAKKCSACSEWIETSMDRQDPRGGPDAPTPE